MLLRFWQLWAILLVFGAGSVWMAVGPPRRTAMDVRARLWHELRAGRLEPCENLLAWLAAHDRITSEDRMVQARLWEMRGRLDDALLPLARINRENAYYSRAQLMVGQIELKRNRARPAESALQAALELDPRLVAARLELIRLYSRQQRTGELNQQCRVLAAQNALDFEHLRFWSLTRNVPWNPEGDLDALAKSVAADPDDQASRLALADALCRMGRGEQAQTVLAPLPDSDTDVQLARARLATNRGDLESAALLVARGPERHAGLARLRGLIALSRRDMVAAIHHLQIARDLDPDDRSTQNALSVALRLAGKTDSARPTPAPPLNYETLDNLVTRLSEPEAHSDALLLRQMGTACESIGRKDEARAWYQLAVARDPLDSTAQQGLFRLSQAPDPTRTVPPGR